MEIINGPTPNGGEYAHIYYFDAKGKTSDKENAVNGNIVEFDKNGNRIRETHFVFKDKFNKSFQEEKIEVFSID